MGIIIYHLTGGSTDVITWCDDHLTIATPLAARVSSGLVIEILEYLPDRVLPADHEVRRNMLYDRVELWQQHLHSRDGARAEWRLAEPLDPAEPNAIIALVTIEP